MVPCNQMRGQTLRLRVYCLLGAVVEDLARPKILPLVRPLVARFVAAWPGHLSFPKTPVDVILGLADHPLP